MKKLALPLCLAIALMSCGSEERTDEKASAAAIEPAQVAAAPIPPALDQKFTRIMDEYQQKISHDFFTQFTSTTRRGGDGTTETTFDATAFEAYMKKKGFVAVPDVSQGYTGTVDDVEVTTSEKTVSGERGGWIQQWTIGVKADQEGQSFSKKREFSIEPGATTVSKDQ